MGGQAGLSSRDYPLLIICRRKGIRHSSVGGMTRPAGESPQALLRNIATNLRKHRLARGLSQEAFADLCGYHRTYIGAVERAERNITIETLCALATSLNLHPLDLLGATDE
jgi:DNA-binding XRE family transcriptional regulator